MPRRPVTMNVGCHKEARRLGWATSSPTSTSAIFSIDSVSRPMPRSSSAHMCVTNGIEVKVPSMLGLMKPSPTYRLALARRLQHFRPARRASACVCCPQCVTPGTPVGTNAHPQYTSPITAATPAIPSIQRRRVSTQIAASEMAIWMNVIDCASLSWG